MPSKIKTGPKNQIQAETVVEKRVALLAERRSAPAAASTLVPRPTAKSAPSRPLPTSAPAGARTPASSGDPVLRKNDLYDKVMSATGAKKAVVKEVIEATLTVLAGALSTGSTLHLPPLGKIKVSRQQDQSSGKPMTIKLRLTDAPTSRALSDKPALAATDD